MGKNAFRRLKNIMPAALVPIGWFLFALGTSIPGIPYAVKLLLLSAARVLP